MDPDKPRPIHVIAREIDFVWHKVYYGARDYLDAMKQLTDIDDYYGVESASSIIVYFLANARTFRGEEARRIKKELKELLK
jgi:asparagine synthetase B (glutamine-hydrolysing)